MKARIAASTADYLWVGAHHPVYSIGGHGPTAPLVEYVKPLLEKYEANYFNGHDHNLQHIREANSTVNYVVTGAGMQCCYPENYASIEQVPKGSVRFAMVGGPGDGPTGSGYEPMPFSMRGGEFIKKYHITLHTANQLASPLDPMYSFCAFEKCVHYKINDTDGHLSGMLRCCHWAEKMSCR